jgi:hypothetical protein
MRCFVGTESGMEGGAELRKIVEADHHEFTAAPSAKDKTHATHLCLEKMFVVFRMMCRASG